MNTAYEVSSGRTTGSRSSTTDAAHEKTRREYEAERVHISTNAHRELVRLALAAGKRVPAKVLQDYPELLLSAIPRFTFSRVAD